jgi:transcriptional regulator with XRE-family HTH domain
VATHQLRARRRLSDRLRELRGDRPGRVFADTLGWGQSKVSKIETGRQMPSPEDLHAWALETGGDITELITLLDLALAEYASMRDVFAAVGGQDRAQDAQAVREANTQVLVRYQPTMVPALLQTPEYARAVLRLPSAFGETISDDDLARAVAGRMRRQAILLEPGRDICLLMGEGALWTRVTSIDVHVDQMDHLARVAETTTAKVGVVPFSVQAPFVSVSGFAIYDDTVTIETLGGDVNIADPVEVGEYAVFTRLLLEVAALGPDAAALVRQVRGQIR